MHEVITNCWLLARAIFKVSWMTGIGPGFLVVAIWKWWYRRKAAREREPQIIVRQSLTWGERTAQNWLGSTSGNEGAGARPSDLKGAA
jgi:hypothetical protein